MIKVAHNLPRPSKILTLYMSSYRIVKNEKKIIGEKELEA